VLVWWTARLGSGSSTWCFIDFVNLAFHESGHLFLSPFGSTLGYLGGTILQLLVPGGLVAYFLFRRGDPFAAAVCLWWFGENFINIAIYMADARSLALPLVGGGDHDWNELFYRWGVLTQPAVQRIAAATHGIGVIVMLLGLAWCGWFLQPESRREPLRRRMAIRYPWSERLLS
jgi:hypothetical protein